MNFNHESQFNNVARHSAVQALLGTCYAENLRIVSAVLTGKRPECSCLQKGSDAHPIKRLPLHGDDMKRLAKSCGDCRQALEHAATAWQSGDRLALREHLRGYREAHAHVRSELLSMAS